MNIVKRFGGGSVAAIGVTFGLAALMAAMIAVEFAPAEKSTSAKFDINPVAEDIAPPDRRIKPKALKKVETPPAPPPIARQAAMLPSESIIEVKGAEMDYTRPDLDIELTSISIIDRNPQPLVRIPPIMPSQASKSGRCKIRFDVSAEGSPYNVTALTCTSSIFKTPSVKSVQKWNYNPQIHNGRPVSHVGLETDIVFQLMDDRGKPIPE